MVSLLLQSKPKKEKATSDHEQKDVSLRVTSAAIAGAIRKRWSMIWNKPTEELDQVSSSAS